MAQNTISNISDRVSSERGASMVEYMLIIAGILMVAIPSITSASICVSDKFTQTGYIIGGSEGSPPLAC